MRPTADLYATIHAQRACRAFSDRPVDDDLVAEVLTAATHAPSAENAQPWVFLVLRDPERRAMVGDLARRAWEEGAKRYAEARLEPGLLADVDRGATGGVAAAPVLVLVCGDGRRAHPDALAASVFPAVQNLLLAAAGAGLGSALTTLPVVRGGDLPGLFALPPEVVPMAVVPLGWPSRPLGPPRRRPLAEVAHRERYGAGW